MALKQYLYDIGESQLTIQPERAIKCFYKAGASIEDVVAQIEATKKFGTEILGRIFVALKQVGEHNSELADSLEKSMPESTACKDVNSLFEYVTNVLKEYLYKNPAEVEIYQAAGFEADGLLEVLSELKERCQTRAGAKLDSNNSGEAQDMISKLEEIEQAALKVTK